MFLVREVFHAKPGKAKELVKIFKSMMSEMEQGGVKNVKVMTDAVSNYWTVVMESEVEDLNAYINMGHNAREDEMKTEHHKQNPTTDYRDLVIDGYREVFRIE